VMALLGGGGYGDRIAVHERMLMPVPASLSFTEAASIPEVFLTAFDALFMQCNLQPGENVLVHAVGSGVGSAAVQLASAVGCRVFGTAGSEDKLARAKELGLEVGVNYHDGDFAEAVKEHTNARGVDVILDVVGAAYWPLNISAMAQRARMIVVGTMGGAKVEVDLGALMAKRASVQGTLLRARPLEEKAALTQAFVKRCLPMFEAGRLRPVVDRVYPIADVGEAHTYMETNANFGKIVLEHAVR
jgi:NADPH:quinone reductase